MSEPIIFKLANGIRVVHQPMDREVAHCGLMIGAGSRDELSNEHGLAHFMEHSFFKGTTKRKTFHILSRLDAVGGEINAFTAKEETWIHASFLKEHYERAIELIADIAFNATFPDKEIEKEKEVIVDEINSYKDSPSDMVFEEFDELIFGKHPIGRTILGTEKTLATFTKEHLIEFRRRNFSKQNLIFSSVGNIPLATLKKILSKYMEPHELTPRSSRKKINFTYKPVQREIKKDIHQVHYIMGNIAYDYNNEKRPALSLLNNILGGPAMNNRLSLNIREKHGIAYHIDSSYAPFSDIGVFSIYLGTEKENLEKSRLLIWKELNDLKHNKLSTRQLHEAKKQIMGQIAISQDSGAAIMFNLGKSLSVFHRIDPIQEVFQKVEALTAKQLQEVANEIFSEKKMSTLAYTY
jgi:predicted Zn-dependent peptidase